MMKRYQQMAISLYISVIVATLLLALAEQHNIFTVNGMIPGNNHPTGLPSWVTIIGNIVIIACLIFLEYLLRHQSLPDLPRGSAIYHLVVRFLLVSIAIFTGRAPFAVYMVYPVMLFTFFTFGPKLAYVVTFASSLTFIGFMTRISQESLLSITGLNNLFVFFLGMLIVLFMASALQKEWKTSQQLQQAHDELADSNKKLQAYSAQVATLTETDVRNQLARDIHDSLGHHLAATSIQLEKASAYQVRNPEKSLEALNHARRTIREALGDVRTSVQSLRESEGQFDLIPALNDLIKRMSHHDLTIELKMSGDSSSYSIFSKMTLYRIIQEGITNIHKHACASHATVELAFSPEYAILNIIDDGKGFDTGNASNREQDGYGLKGIRERVALIGGSYEITSELQKGTQISITIPKNSEVKG